MSPLKQNGWPVIDRHIVIHEIEFCRMNGDAAGLEDVDRLVDEIDAGFDRSQVFERANRPAKIIVPQIVGDGGHIYVAEIDQRVESGAIEKFRPVSPIWIAMFLRRNPVRGPLV